MYFYICITLYFLIYYWYLLIYLLISDSHPSEIILICCFGAQETFLIIINVENSCLIFIAKTVIHFLKNSEIESYRIYMKQKRLNIFIRCIHVCHRKCRMVVGVRRVCVAPTTLPIIIIPTYIFFYSDLLRNIPRLYLYHGF